MVECQLPKLDVAGSNPVSRSKNQQLTAIHKISVTALSSPPSKLKNSRVAKIQKASTGYCVLVFVHVYRVAHLSRPGRSIHPGLLLSADA